ncbi:MAG: hypothetical protein ACPLF9_08580 [Methanothermobacter tenebrarum]|nr:hypothetical protein [Methanobacteriales archaeon]NPV64751.1 hypothetical protein [Methanobacteriaceae archaeon]
MGENLRDHKEETLRYPYTTITIISYILAFLFAFSEFIFPPDDNPFSLAGFVAVMIDVYLFSRADRRAKFHASLILLILLIPFVLTLIRRIRVLLTPL